MKQKVFSTSVVLLSVAFVMVMFASSCSKSSNANTAYVGTYIGSSMITHIDTILDTISIAAGSSSNAVVLNAKTSAGTHYTFNGTVSGSNLLVASQSFQYGSLTDTITGTGTLSGSALQIDYTITEHGTPYAWQYNGTKQ